MTDVTSGMLELSRYILGENFRIIMYELSPAKLLAFVVVTAGNAAGLNQFKEAALITPYIISFYQ